MNAPTSTQPYTATEIMTVVAARALKNDDVVFVGIGAPSAACNLARLTHAPDITLIYESGTIGTKPNVLPLSIGVAMISLEARALSSSSPRRLATIFSWPGCRLHGSR